MDVQQGGTFGRRPWLGNVGLLHSNVRQLGYTIPDEEFEKQYFGNGTRFAVMQFQKRQSLDATGEVDERTADTRNEWLKSIGADHHGGEAVKQLQL